jgi:hypothetical protein
MSRITGSDAKGLMDAYGDIHSVKEELNVDLIWEEVETWVNSLIEEGYDLSDYTWEEMYESYLEEQERKPPQGDVGYRVGRGLLGALRDLPSATMAQLQGRENEALRRQGQRGEKLKSAVSSVFQGSKPSATAKPEPQKPLIDNSGRNVFDGTPAPGRSPAAPPTAASSTAPSGRTPAASPRPTAAPKPAPAPVARQTGDKVKDMGTWAKANPTLAKKVDLNTPSTSYGMQKGTGQSQMSKQAAELRAMTQASKDRQSTTQTQTPSPSPRPVGKSEMTASNIQRARRLNMGMEYDAYDLVLEYLLSEGHVETVEEAHYVMMEMDAEMIGTIVEAAEDQSDKQIDKGVKTTYKAQNVLDNQHQGRSKGLNKLPADKRAAKTKRMQGRLKARRDDLFGERNKREDSRRDELKKMLGL